MVGPSLTEDDRRRGMARLKLGFVLLVAVSGGLIAYQAGGTVPFVVGGLAGGALLGYVLIRYLFYIVRPISNNQRRQRQR